jgi:hypothetical protein
MNCLIVLERFRCYVLEGTSSWREATELDDQTVVGGDDDMMMTRKGELRLHPLVSVIPHLPNEEQVEPNVERKYLAEETSSPYSPVARRWVLQTFLVEQERDVDSAGVVNLKYQFSEDRDDGMKVVRK